MARPLALLLLVLLAGLLSCPGAMTRYAPDCAKYGKYSCPRDYHPVCGTDGETYGNECVLCLANRAEGWALRYRLTFLGCFIFLVKITRI